MHKSFPGESTMMLKNYTLLNKNNCSRADAGFTMTEVIVVIAIIGILSAIALPAILSWLPDMKLRSVARDIYSGAQRARAEAVRTNSDWAIVFDVPNNRYDICSSAGADLNFDTLIDNTIANTVNLSTSGSGIALTVPIATMIFNSRGMANAGSVRLQNSKGTAYTVVTGVSGVITLNRL
jgi:prepilin-type N-terminal cleavage/methylation domain-containing protein